MPIKSQDQVIGVLQLINKGSGAGVFTTDDEDVMMIFLSIAGPILASSNLYSQIQGKSKGKDSKIEQEAIKGSLSHGKVEANTPHMSGMSQPPGWNPET